MAVQGERTRAGFILITGIDGTRYAVRQQAVTVSTARRRATTAVVVLLPSVLSAHALRHSTGNALLLAEIAVPLRIAVPSTEPASRTIGY
jgi:hypothetical protein